MFLAPWKEVRVGEALGEQGRGVEAEWGPRSLC